MLHFAGTIPAGIARWRGKDQRGGDDVEAAMIPPLLAAALANDRKYSAFVAGA